MNYLSHYFIDHIDDDHYYNAALILPDITKKWVKTFKHPNPSRDFSQNQTQLLKGALQHYESDKQFHSSAFFQFYSNAINDLLKSVPFSDEVNRRWFIAHVLLELLIDRKIVQSLPVIADQFYFSLNIIDDSELASLLRFYGLVNPHDFFVLLNHFRNVKYIYYYGDNNKFLYSLNRIMMRVGLKELNDRDAGLMLDAILEMEVIFFANPNILSDLKKVFVK